MARLLLQQSILLASKFFYQEDQILKFCHIYLEEIRKLMFIAG